MKSATALPGTQRAPHRRAEACLVLVAVLFFCTPAQIKLRLKGPPSVQRAGDQASATIPRELRRFLGAEERVDVLASDAADVNVLLAPPVAKPIIFKQLRKEILPAVPALPGNVWFRPPPLF
jgi:hypothetical protein